MKESMAVYPSHLDLDVVGFGNALVDVLSHQDEEFIERIGAIKGGMNLVDGHRSAELYQLVGERTTVSGGSAANTVIGVNSLGGSCAYIGRVGNDDLGEVFASDMERLSIGYTTPRAPAADPTGRCIVFITPDGERTLNTFLGASNGLSSSDVDLGLVRETKLLRGLPMGPAEAKAAMRYAASEISSGTTVALTLSDQFCVERHRDSFLDLIDEHVDAVFMNHHEVMSLFEVDQIDVALDMIQERVELAAVTLGSRAPFNNSTERITIDADRSASCRQTGAGDLYAQVCSTPAAQGYDLQRCGMHWDP